MGGIFGSSGFPNNEWTVTETDYVIAGDTHDGTPVIDNLASTSSLREGMPVTGVGIGASAKVLTVDSSTQVTLDKNSTIDDTGVSITFESEFVVPNGVTVVWVTAAGGGQEGGGQADGTVPASGGSTSFGSYLTVSGGADTPDRIRTPNGGSAQRAATSGNAVSGNGGELESDRVISVTPGESIDITIGSGGTGNTAGQAGGDGILTVKWSG